MKLRIIHSTALFAIATTIVFATATLTACSSKPEAIDRIVKELNSPQFKAREIETGLFTGSEAKIEGDTLMLTLFCRPALDLTAIPPDKLPELRESALKEFRAYLAERNFKEGIEAMRDNSMVMLLQWVAADGKNVKIELRPADILAAGAPNS